MRLGFALLLSALCGFIALSYEIVWVRVYSFVSQGIAGAFGELLGAYLLGLSLGSLGSILFQDSEKEYRAERLTALSNFVLLANALGFLLIPLVAWLVTKVDHGWSLGLFALVSMLLGATFPLICHFGIAPDEQAGAALSYVYLANIAGSAAGSLLTGFVLMDLLSIQSLSVLLALLGLVLGAALLIPAGLRGRPLATRLGLAAAAAVLVLATSPRLFDRIYEPLQLKQEYATGDGRLPFKDVIETKSGVITVDARGAVYGGGVYDGYLHVDIKKGFWLTRPYALPALHPSPRRVLMIGLSCGAWANIVISNPVVEQMTVVEISRGYLQLIDRYEEVRGLRDQQKQGRLKIVIDDGRRWLARSDQKYDAIIANTTQHWRAYSSNLLSREFLELIKRRLAPGGIYMYNATGSDDVEKTAVEVFPHSMMIFNNVVVSNDPLNFDKQRWRKALLDYKIDGKRIFDLSRQADKTVFTHLMDIADSMDKPEADRRELARVRGREYSASTRLVSRQEMIQRSQHARVVTDDNMATEWYLRR